MEIDRVISIYDNRTEYLVKELDINHLDFDILKNLFKPDDIDYLMYYCYEIREEHIQEFQKLLGLEFDFQNYAYFVECYQKSTPNR